MSAWRRQALEQLPECRRIIESAGNPMALWIELQFACEEACRQESGDLVRRFYEYARWCWLSASADVVTAVASAFYEHIPTSPVLRRDLPRRMGRAEFRQLREIFGCHRSPEELKAFEEEFLTAEAKHVREIL